MGNRWLVLFVITATFALVASAITARAGELAQASALSALAGGLTLGLAGAVAHPRARGALIVVAMAALAFSAMSLVSEHSGVNADQAPDEIEMPELPADRQRA